MLKQLIKNAWRRFNFVFVWLTPLGDLFIRIWVARVFIYSGLAKVSNWTGTILLFQYEYHVPFLNPEVSAVIAVIIELGVASLLILGLGGRIPAMILFVFNIMAVLCYPFLCSEQGYVGFKEHVAWGVVLLVILLHGTGKLSLDYLFSRWQQYKKD